MRQQTRCLVARTSSQAPGAALLLVHLPLLAEQRIQLLCLMASRSSCQARLFAASWPGATGTWPALAHSHGFAQLPMVAAAALPGHLRQRHDQLLRTHTAPPAPEPRWHTHMGSLSSPWWLRRRSPGTGGSGATRYMERWPRRGNAWRASAPPTYSVSLPARDAGRGAGERDVVSCMQPTARQERSSVCGYRRKRSGDLALQPQSASPAGQCTLLPCGCSPEVSSKTAPLSRTCRKEA